MLLHKWTPMVHKQYIQVDIIFNYIFHFGLQENACRKVRNTHLCSGTAGARKVCFEDLNNDISWKSKMKHIVKYDVAVPKMPDSSSSMVVPPDNKSHPAGRQ